MEKDETTHAKRVHQSLATIIEHRRGCSKAEDEREGSWPAGVTVPGERGAAQASATYRELGVAGGIRREIGTQRLISSNFLVSAALRTSSATAVTPRSSGHVSDGRSPPFWPERPCCHIVGRGSSPKSGTTSGIVCTRNRTFGPLVTVPRVTSFEASSRSVDSTKAPPELNLKNCNHFEKGDRHTSGISSWLRYASLKKRLLADC